LISSGLRNCAATLAPNGHPGSRGSLVLSRAALRRFSFPSRAKES
jgi:hypothetical protein